MHYAYLTSQKIPKLLIFQYLSFPPPLPWQGKDPSKITQSFSLSSKYISSNMCSAFLSTQMKEWIRNQEPSDFILDNTKTKSTSRKKKKSVWSSSGLYLIFAKLNANLFGLLPRKVVTLKRWWRHTRYQLINTPSR